MTTNYSMPTNYISGSKANVHEKHAASVKSLKLKYLWGLTSHAEKIQHESVVAFV